MTRHNVYSATKLCQCAFSVSVLVFFYGTLFPLHFDFSTRTVTKAWSMAKRVPYWDAKRRRPGSMPDIVSNIMLTMPLGGFGFLWRQQKRGATGVWKWGGIGLGLGLLVEALQLGIPSRVPSLTDALNNAGGALGGATLAHLLGPRCLAVLTGTWSDRDRTLALLLLCILIATMLGPFDITLDVGSVKAHVQALWHDPWEAHKPIGDEWMQMAEWVVFGAVAGTLVRTRNLPPGWCRPAWGLAVLALPVGLELAQLFVHSHAPSMRDMLMGLIGIGSGLLCSIWWPTLSRPLTGLIVITLGLVAAGVSPYQCVPWEHRSSFTWIPFYEYYTHTTPGAFYDAAIGLLYVALWAALLKASCHCSRWPVIVGAITLAGAIECVQLLVPTRSAGLTDILIAALGAWMGDYVWAMMQSTGACRSKTQGCD